MPALRARPRGVEGRPGRAAPERRALRGPRLPAAAAALPGGPFAPPRRERSLAKFPSFVSGARAWLPPSWGSRGRALFLPVRALRLFTRVGVVSSLPPGHVRTPPSPLAPHPVHLHSRAGRRWWPGRGVAGTQGRRPHSRCPLDFSRSHIYSARFLAIKLPSFKNVRIHV